MENVSNNSSKTAMQYIYAAIILITIMRIRVEVVKVEVQKFL